MATQPAPAKVEPLTADLRRLHMTVSKRFMQKLEAARDARTGKRDGRGFSLTLALSLSDGEGRCRGYTLNRKCITSPS